MATPMDIDPPVDNTVAEVKGKGKEEKPRFQVKKVNGPVFFSAG